MARRVRMFCGVLINRTIATPRPAAYLARPQVHPRGTDLHTLFADALLWVFDFGDGVDMNARFWRHDTSPLESRYKSYLFTDR